MERRIFLKMCGIALAAPAALATTEPKVSDFCTRIKKKLLMFQSYGKPLNRIHLWVNYQGYKLIDGHIGINSQQPDLYDVPTCISRYGYDDTEPWYCIRWGNCLMGGGTGVHNESYAKHSYNRK